MTGFLPQHLAGVAFFMGVVLLIALSNLVALRRLAHFGKPAEAPRVSILVPARNEEHNIGSCVRSLLAQRYPDFELLVLDDGSTDRTGEILAALHAEDPRLRVLGGTPLPAGWLGKHWACHQLAKAASGELLLFVDADTRHHPEALANAVAALQAEDADLVTALPRQVVGTWAERLVIPILPWSVLSFIPLAVAHRVRLPLLAVAVGQFMLFRRAAYDAVGGHAAVRTSPVDDIALARRVKAAHLRWRLVDGVGRVEARMYRGRAEVVAGISRTLYAVFGNLPAHLFVWLWLGVAFIEPPVLLAAAALGAPLPSEAVMLAAGCVAAALALWWITAVRFRFPLYLALLYPVVVALGVGIALRSALLTAMGRTTWKGRPVVRGS